MVFKASMADSLPDSLALDDADAAGDGRGHGRGDGDGERSDLVDFQRPFRGRCYERYFFFFGILMCCVSPFDDKLCWKAHVI